ncbi:replication initiator protein [Microviridae sp.]|nr:replication initiator protein [Microviridae sp.]
MACYSPLKGYKDRETGGLTFKKTHPIQEDLTVACGQCLGCRTDRALMWAMRIVHESTLHDDQFGNCFITLTYRDRSECTIEQLKNGHYMPEDGSLNKKHFRDFIKRVRKHFPQRIRYFHCGEYGEETWRPHYHACLFNVGFDDVLVYKQDEGLTTYSSPTLERLWPYGFSTIGELNYETAAYTARYCLKKITGHQAQTHYLRCDDYGVAYWLQPEYVTMSLKPGIGRNFYEKFKDDIFPSDETPIPGRGVVQKVPRYYETILANENPRMHELVKEIRQKFIEEHGEDYSPERLMDRYKVHRSKTNRRNTI